MNRSFIATSVTLLSAALLLTAGSCQKNMTPSPGTSGTGALRLSAPFVDQTTTFAFESFRTINAAEGPGTNVFVSPMSLHMALGMILNGANGQTAQEIQKTLRLDAQTLAEANQTYANLLDALPRTDPKVTMTLANSVWYRNTFNVEPSFQDVLKQTFRAEISAQNFSDPATVGRINGWASAQTNGKIPKVIDQISPENVMFLLNALYFKGDWKTQFKEDQTVDMPFTLANGREKTVRMMRQNVELRRAFKPTYTAVELPYGNGQFAMTVLRPADNTTADAVLNNLTAAEWKALQSELMPGKLDFGLPKFTLSYEIKLNETLAKLGMPTAFTDRADFTKINRNGGLLLSLVKQNTFVAVDEKGTEAAAVTTGGISVTSVQLPTLCDRPFVVVIHEKTSGAILFTGKIADPQTAP